MDTLYTNISKIINSRSYFNIEYLDELEDLVTKDCYKYIWTYPDMITKVQFDSLIFIMPEATCACLLTKYKIPVAYICNEIPEYDKFITCMRFTNYTDILQCYNIEEQKIIIICIFNVMRTDIFWASTTAVEYMIQYITIAEYLYISSYINYWRGKSKQYIIMKYNDVWCNNLTIITNHYDDLLYQSSLRTTWITACILT